MTTNRQNEKRPTTRIVLDPPTFIPSPDMRAGYLNRRRAELEEMIVNGRLGEWKPVMTIANHVRGTGAMYGFANIGDAAGNLVRAVQNGDSQSFSILEEYARTVNQAYV